MKDNIILFKSADKGVVKDVDKTKRIVTGFFSSFGDENSIDSDGDVMAKGAFDATLMMNGVQAGNRIWHLFNHSQNSPINKPYILKVDKFGLYFETKFPDTTLGNDILTLYDEKAITEHSIGFNIIQARMEKAATGEDYQLIQEVRLWEGSSVLWGANENTPTIGIKSVEFEIKSKVLDNILHNGNLSDDMFLQIEKMLNEIKNTFMAPIENEPEIITQAPGLTEAEIKLLFYSKLLKK